MTEKAFKEFKGFLHEIEEKVNKCDNNTPFLAADFMYTISRNIEDRALTIDEGSKIKEELYKILKDFRKCRCI